VTVDTVAAWVPTRTHERPWPRWLRCSGALRVGSSLFARLPGLPSELLGRRDTPASTKAAPASSGGSRPPAWHPPRAGLAFKTGSTLRRLQASTARRGHLNARSLVVGGRSNGRRARSAANSSAVRLNFRFLW